MHLLITALAIVALSYAGICLMLYFGQSRLVYVPNRALTATPADVGLPYEDVTLTTPDGPQLHAWYVPVDEPTAETRTVLYCHGNAGNISDRVETFRHIRSLGLNVFMFDYRGYGSSTGSPTEAGTYQDALTAWTYLINERQVPPERILIYGHSLGCAVACWLAGEVRPGALMLEAPFTSTTDMGVALYPFLPVRQLSRFNYDNLTRIGLVRCPILIAHGRDDTTVPFAHGMRVYEQAPEPKRFLAFSGDHNASMEQDPAYQAAFLDWLASLARP